MSRWVAWVVCLHGVAACTSDADCSYNGNCSHTVEAGLSCVCVPQFTGAACDVFSFAPIDVTRCTNTTIRPDDCAPNGDLKCPQPCCRTGIGYKHRDSDGQRVSSWGGSVLYDANDGKYHMWAAEMSEHTGIKAWITNSRVVHAVADAPTSSSTSSSLPFDFVRKEVVQPVFAHEPTVARAPKGEYVMWYTTNYGEAPGSQCGPPCTCGVNGTSCLSCPNDQQCSAEPRSPMSTRMSYAYSPYGPWSIPVLVPAPTQGDTNLACVIRANASLVCLGRPGLGMLHAPHWQNVSSYTWHIPHGVGIRGEDPMVWMRHVEQGGEVVEVLHAVTHGGGWGDPFGYHYFSTDGGFSWGGKQRKVYDNTVEFSGTRPSLILSRRERPHVVLDANGELLALTNGVTEAWPCTLQEEPDRPPCKKPFTPGVNPTMWAGIQRHIHLVP
jgi:hypothetical protein